MKLILGAFLGLMLAATASADTVWTYTGNVISYLGFNPGPGGVAPPLDIGVNPCNCTLNGTVLLDATNQATAWSFTDGAHTLTNFNSTASIDPIYIFNTDDVIFRHWHVMLEGHGIFMLSQFDGSYGDAQDSVWGAGVPLSVESDPGTWTEVAATPEPATGLLLGIGLAALAFKRRRRPADTSVWETLA